jgi:DNA-binding SARP family transcriptional activator
MSRLTLYLFGSPRIELDGLPLEVDRRKAIALLIYLALTPQTHSRDAQATLFWPGYDQTNARAN